MGIFIALPFTGDQVLIHYTEHKLQLVTETDLISSVKEVLILCAEEGETKNCAQNRFIQNKLLRIHAQYLVFTAIVGPILTPHFAHIYFSSALVFARRSSASVCPYYRHANILLSLPSLCVSIDEQ